MTLGEDASPFGFMRVSNYKVLDCLSVISDQGGIVGGNVVVHNLAEVKSPVSEKVHDNRDWETGLASTTSSSAGTTSSSTTGKQALNAYACISILTNSNAASHSQSQPSSHG